MGKTLKIHKDFFKHIQFADSQLGNPCMLQTSCIFSKDTPISHSQTTAGGLQPLVTTYLQLVEHFAISTSLEKAGHLQKCFW